MKALVFLTSLLMSVYVWAAEVDQEASQFKWTATKVTGKHYGKVPVKTAAVKINKRGMIKSGEFVLDLTKFTIDDITGKYAAKFLKHMKNEDFFQVEKWPNAKLVLKKVKNGTAKGELTIKGKTQKVKFPYAVNDKTYTGTLKFDRTKFGMKYGSGSFFDNLGDKVIHDEVAVDFKVVLK